jgi:hypothetical protein
MVMCAIVPDVDMALLREANETLIEILGTMEDEDPKLFNAIQKLNHVCSRDYTRYGAERIIDGEDTIQS